MGMLVSSNLPPLLLPCSTGALKEAESLASLLSHAFGKGEAPPSPACECGTMLQCRTVLASVPKCGNPEGLEADQDLAPLCRDWYQSLLHPSSQNPLCDGGCAP